MDHVRSVSLDLSFGPFNFEHQLPFPTAQRELLEDVALTLHGHATTDHQNAIGPDGIRLYFDDVDATPAYLAELRAVIDLQDEQKLRQAYKDALDAWIALARALGAGYGSDPEADARVAADLLKVTPLSALLDQLGNRPDAGRAGFLHVFNFLYTAIPLPPISLRKVVTRANEMAGKELISPQQPRVVTVSAGPCRLFDRNWKPFKAGGSVFLLAEFRYHNALADQVNALEKRLADLEAFVEGQLQEIAVALGPDGDLQRAILQARGATREARDGAQDLKVEVGSQNAQLAGLKAAAQDLREAIEKL